MKVLRLKGVEAVFSLGAYGVVGGPGAVGWRLEAMERRRIRSKRPAPAEWGQGRRSDEREPRSCFRLAMAAVPIPRAASFTLPP